MLFFRERITSLKSAGIDKIWMTVSNSGDFSMANLLGFLYSDLVLILKTTGLMNNNNSINKSDKWAGRIGIQMEWNLYSHDRWCRFMFESKLNSTPRNNTDELLKNFNAAKATNGCGGARRSAFPPDVLTEINQYLAQQPERSSLSSVGVIPASLSASEKSALIKKAADEAEVIEQRRMRKLENEMSLLELFTERDADEQEEVFQECLRRRVQSKANFVSLKSLNGNFMESLLVCRRTESCLCIGLSMASQIKLLTHPRNCFVLIHRSVTISHLRVSSRQNRGNYVNKMLYYMCMCNYTLRNVNN